MRSVCLVSPGHLASNPRVIKEADALHEAGYRVTVVAGDLTDFVRPFDEEIVARVPWHVIRVSTPSVGLRLKSRAARALGKVAAARRGTAIAAYSAQVGGLAQAASSVQADLYVAHYVAALPAAAVAAQRNGALLGYDAEDFHAGEGNSTTAAFVRSIEGAYLSRCRHLTAASPLIAEAYEKLYGVKPISVLNVFPLAEADTSVPKEARRNGELSAYWFSQTIGPDRGLEAFVAAIKRARARVTLHVRGSDQGHHGEGLIAVAREHGVSDRIELMPMASSYEMVSCARRCDIGLSLETEISESRRRCLTNKIFVYLLAGLPVLMSDTPAQRAFAPQLGLAARLATLADPDGIAAILDDWAFSADSLKNSSSAALQLARTRFNWDVEKRLFLASVESALSGERGQPCRA